VKEFRAQDVLDFWFGPNPLGADELPRRLRMWFGGDDPPEVRRQNDERLAGRFGTHVEAAAAGELDAWAASPRRLLALILLLDQFPRQLWRGKARSFAQDPKAAALVQAGLATSADAALSSIERVFFYMPLQHAEDLSLQQESLAAFARLAAEIPVEHRDLFDGIGGFARTHHDVVARFGRFPHRNTVLGRSTTPEEMAWLRGDTPGWAK
jgi:uncharacterized protein (DUF924 family)